MNWCDQRLGLDPAVGLTQETLAQSAAKLATLLLDDLVRGWREVNTAGLCDQTSGVYAFSTYFDRIGHDDPERALAFIVTAVAAEPDDAMVAMMAHGKLLTQLLHFNAPRVVAPLEAAAVGTPRLRWLLGAVAWACRGGMVDDEAVAHRLLAIADEPAYKAWELRHKAGRETINFAMLPVAEVARYWVELTARSPLERERDDHFSNMFDFQREVASDEPERALALVKEIVRIEDHPMMLSMLAAGFVEDLLVANGTSIIEAVEAEAAVNLRFRQVLCGAYLSSADPAVAQRIRKAAAQTTS